MDVEVTKMSPKGQVVIPHRIRDELRITAGNRFFVYVKDDTIVFKKLDLHLGESINPSGH